MLYHSITIYSCPTSFSKMIKQASRNFIWSENVFTKNLVTIAWTEVCQPKDYGGLGLRSLITLNEASNLKHGWDMFNSDEY